MTDAQLDEFLGQARKRFSAAAEDERHLREKFKDDLRFASPDGDMQWDEKIKQDRVAAGRPAMSFPRCHTFVQQVSNEARQNKPQIKFAPRLDADKDTAEIYEGLARYIQYASDAQVAYETAIEYSAGGSFGYYRFLTEYCDDDSDDLDLVIKPVLDPLTVYGILVPAIFGRDPKFWFVVEDIPKDEYKQKYGESRMASLSWDEAERECAGWVGSEMVRIAEYWTVEEKRVKGKRRPQRTIKFCKTNGMEILPGDDGETSETVWPGTLCNIIPVLGKQLIIEGDPQLSSVVRPQKAAQQLINYSKSRIAETLSTSPVSPWLMVEGQAAGYEKQWENSNKVITPFLTYKAVDVAGRPAPPPQRQVYEPPINSLSEFVAQEVEDMKATTGIFDASLGNRGNETSGQAIARRQQQADMTTMHFMDNLVRSFKKGGEVIAELIPILYDAEREIQILGEDEAPKVVQINREHKDAKGNPVHYDMTKGKYALTVTSGKAFDSKRSETFDTMQQLIQSAPNMLPIFADIMFRNSDMAGAEQAAERFHKMLPPALQDNQEDIPPQAQAAIAQAQQQAQFAMQEHAKIKMEQDAKVVEHQGKMQEIQLKYQGDIALEKMKMENALAIANASTKAQNEQQRDTLFADMLSQFHDQAHDIASQAAQQAHERAMAQIQAQQQSAMAAQQAGHASAQSAQDAAQASDQSAQDAAQNQVAQAQQQTSGAD